MKRIHRAKDKEPILAALTSEQLGVFKELWRLLLFAAQVGIKNNRRVLLATVDAGKGIDQSTFGNSPAWPGILYLTAVAEAKSADPMASTQAAEDSRIQVFEEYANGGLEMMQEYFATRRVDLDGLIAFIQSQNEQPTTPTNVSLEI
jgi:dnd system-associated protein 4